MKNTPRDLKYEDIISAWELLQSQITGSQNYFLFFIVVHVPCFETLDRHLLSATTANSSFWQYTWRHDFWFLYNKASNFKIASPPFTFKRNPCQKHPCGYFVFCLHKTKLPLINETGIIIFFNETGNTLVSAKTAAVFSVMEVRSAQGKQREPGNEVRDTQKDKMHGNKLQEILKNHRKGIKGIRKAMRANVGWYGM